MNVELINTGSELMLGFVLNTNHQWLCRQLTQLGLVVTRQVAVPDSAEAIQTAVREALERAELVICTGGLGPTSDDLTRECIAKLLGKPLREYPEVLEAIDRYFQARGRPTPKSTRVQALAPEGALLLPNKNGTAPGIAIDVPATEGRPTAKPALLLMLPGPPRELIPMFVNEALPMIRQRFPPEDFACLVLRSTGIGESIVEERIAGSLAPLIKSGLEVGYCARYGEVDVRLTARGPDAAALVQRGEAIVRDLLSNYIYGSNNDELEGVVIHLLTERKCTLTLAESCTGGFIANRLTNVPGASAVFLGGFVTYSNEAKQSCLGVRTESLAQHGAVSEQVAREMAEGALARMNATYALAVTGIAGPSGGTDRKPVGTVYIALAGGGRTLVLRQMNPFDRESFKLATSNQALEILRRRLLRLADWEASVG